MSQLAWRCLVWNQIHLCYFIQADLWLFVLFIFIWFTEGVHDYTYISFIWWSIGLYWNIYVVNNNWVHMKKLYLQWINAFLLSEQKNTRKTNFHDTKCKTIYIFSLQNKSTSRTNDCFSLLPISVSAALSMFGPMKPFWAIILPL